jgi:hypothetical protein
MIKALIFVTGVAILFMVLFIVSFVNYQKLEEEIIILTMELSKHGINLAELILAIEELNELNKEDNEHH